MSQELIYTSAPRGLKPGSHGFCTVVSTQGISASLTQRLEALSGYRHVFPPQDPNASLNPVIFSHLILSQVGRRCHVLSRVCDAGLDHTQRTNKFAHHVVLDPRELVPGGPAWLLAAPGFMQAKWDGVAKVLPAGRQPPAGNPAATVCRAWQKITGDAGWGGALAETASPGVNRSAVIVFRPGVDPLPLLVESLALLPPQSRWSVSFCTYFSKLPPGLECQWRCVLEGSPEAIANQRLPGALVIDLARSAGVAPGSLLVEAARSGVAPLAPAAVPRQPAVTGAYRAGDAELARLLSEPGAAPQSASSASRTPTISNAAPRTAGTSGAEIYDLGPPPRAQNAMDLPPQGIPRQFKRKPMSKWPIIGGLAAVVAILLLGIGAVQIANTRRTTTPVATVAPEEEKPISNKSAADAQKSAEEAKAEKVKQAQPPEKAKTDIEEKIKECEQQAVSARDAAKEAAQGAARVTAKVKEWAENSNPSAAATEAPDAAFLANSAKKSATDAQKAADSARVLVTNAGKEISPNATASAENADKAAKEAALSVQRAEASSKEAKKVAEEAMVRKQAADRNAEEAARTTNAIAESLRELDGKEIDFPPCEKGAVTTLVGQISGLGVDYYCLGPVGANDVFPTHYSIETTRSQKPGSPSLWTCSLVTSAENAGSLRSAENILTFYIEGHNLMVRWTDNARSHYKYADQVRNCLWVVSAQGIHQKATICLGKPEPATPVKFMVRRPASGDCAVRRNVDLVSLLVDRTVAIEPLDKKIRNARSSWPVETSGTLPQGSDRTPDEQSWKLVIGEKGKGRIEFSFVGRKRIENGLVRFYVTLRLEKEDQAAIEIKKDSIDGKKKEIAGASLNRDNARKAGDKVKEAELQFTLNKLAGERTTLENELRALKDDLDELRGALDGRPLHYRIMLLFGDKRRVLYTTEAQPIETGGKQSKPS